MATQDLNNEVQLEKEKSFKYRGTARVALQWQVIPNINIDTRHLQELKCRFNKHYQCLESYNHIPALMGHKDLDSALHLSGLAGQSLSTSQEKVFPS